VTQFDAEYAIWLFAAALVLSAGGFRRRSGCCGARAEASLAVLGLGSLLAVQLALIGYAPSRERYSSERLVETVGRGEKTVSAGAALFYSVASFDQSVPFYLGRP